MIEEDSMEYHVAVVYIISDSVGETAESVVRAAASQFDGGHIVMKRVAHVQDISVIEETVHKAHEENAIIAFTLVLPELKSHLVRLSSAMNVMCVDIMGPTLDALETVVGQRPHMKAGLVHQLDEEYFRRVEAIEFAVKYDDGRDPRGLERADVILVGVSRTSKTPLSMYLAHKQVKVANVPLVPEVAAPEELFSEGIRSKVIGLSIRAEKLNLIRQERLKALGLANQANYASIDRILAELAYSDTIMKRLGCTVIDVSDKAVEETAGIILHSISQRQL
jgi:[pyruvate, water dikinase]-phosphate phosphotransferase / [pyruvate, water dikinase] kinase